MNLQNFRCFDHLEVRFHPKLTVIVAENGAGKTAILDAIALGLGRMLTKLPGVTGISSSPTDLRIEHGERRAPFMALSWEGWVRPPGGEGQSIVWTAGRKRDSAVKVAKVKDLISPNLGTLGGVGLKQVDAYITQLIEADAAGSPYLLPVVAYYGTNRAILDEVQRRRGFRKQFTRFDALSGALQSVARFKAAFEWFNAMEDLERREKEKRRNFDFRLPELNVVRSAIVNILPVGFSNPRTETRPLRFVIDRLTPDGVLRTLRLHELSDGFRVMLGLVMDLARRIAHANTSAGGHQLQVMNPLALPALALIDEIDLHLHPAWQQRVLADLMRTFPGTQFIVTTHSPQVLSTVRRENIRVIGSNREGQFIAEPPLAMTYGEPSGQVMHSVMQVDPQPPVLEKHDLQRLTELVDQGAYATDEAQNLMQALHASLGETHPQLQRLKRSILRQAALKA